MRVVIVGAGPVACLLAVGLRRRGIEVDLFERRPDLRRGPGNRSHSFNLTLTSRGLRTLEPALRDRFYGHGVELPQRVIHQVDGQTDYQPYGIEDAHHLLSIPRTTLHHILLDEAESAGARLHFGHECIDADPSTARVTVAAEGRGLRQVAGDVLVGCDGAGSIVRQEMSRHGAPLSVSQDYIAHGYIELRMPPTAAGDFALARAWHDETVAESRRHGLHVWPRGEFMLLAQPNVDRSYTTSLFMPMASGSTGGIGLEDLVAGDGVEGFFTEHFEDVMPYLPDLCRDVTAAPPAPLRTLRCAPYHHQRAVLVGDAAHTMVPFFGQGINCSFEDVATLLALVDEHCPATGDRATNDVPAALAAFTDAREQPVEAITQLSLANLEELSLHTGHAAFHARSTLEKELQRADPDRFMPLYDMVAFTDIPYHEAVGRHERNRPVVDTVLRAVEAGSPGPPTGGSGEGAGDGRPAAEAGEDPPAAPTLPLTLSLDQSRALLTAVTDRISGYHRDLAEGRFPASFLHGAGEALRVDAASLREDDPPRRATPVGELLDAVFDRAALSGMVHPHPGFLAQVPSGGLFQAAVGDFVGRTLNRFVSVEAAAPGITQIEANVIRWFCSMLGYGAGSFGYLTTGGSIATLMGLRCALSALDDESAATVYVADQGHFSVTKAARLVGVPAERIRVVGTHADHTVDVDELRHRIREDRRSGAVPAAVVATAGTTNVGAVDDLVAVASLCRSEDVWLHVDACLGGFFRLTARGQELLAGIEQADSIAVDAHKSLFLPHGTSALLVQDAARLSTTFATPGASYIPELDADGPLDLCHYGPELTREARGLTAWLPLKMHGVPAFEQALDSRLDLADELAQRLRGVPGIEVVDRGDPHLPVVAFAATGADPAARDARTRRLCERVCARGHVYLATTRLPGVGLVARACVLHPQTDESTVAHLLDDLRQVLHRETEESP